MERKQEIIDFMKTKMSNGSHSAPYEIADKAADMFDLWETDPDHPEWGPGLPEWLLDAAEDIFYD